MEGKFLSPCGHHSQRRTAAPLGTSRRSSWRTPSPQTGSRRGRTRNEDGQHSQQTEALRVGPKQALEGDISEVPPLGAQTRSEPEVCDVDRRPLEEGCSRDLHHVSTVTRERGNGKGKRKGKLGKEWLPRMRTTGRRYSQCYRRSDTRDLRRWPD
jgi:hypothetical protein